MTDRIVARFPSTADDAAIQNTINAYDLEDTKEPSRRPGRRVLRVPRARIAKLLSIANSLHEDPATLWATPEIIAPVVKQQINDPLYNDQWHLNNVGGVANLTADADIDIPEAWSLSSNADPTWMIHQGNAAIIVSVPDPDGVDTQHPDLAANSIGSRGGVTDPHGTGCAGLVVGDSNTIGGRGVAPFCSLLGAEVTNSSEAVDAFDWSVEHGAAVISNSWSITTLFQDLVDAIQSAVADGREGRGCVVLFAAGNDFGTVEQNNPYAALAEVVCVGASTSMDVHAAYSNAGESDDTVDLVAPSGPAADSEYGTFTNGDSRGQYLRTCDLTGSDGYNDWNSLGPTDLADLDYTELFSGTSGATPIAAGVAALLLSTNPDLTADEAKQILYASADQIDAGHPDYARYYGHGRINAYKAVEKALVGHYTTGKVRLQDIVGVSWELNPRTIGAGGTFELAGLELSAAQRAQMDRVLAAWLVLDIEDVDNGTEVSVLSGTGKLMSHCPPTGSGNRRPVVMSLPLDEIVLQESNGPFKLRNNDWLLGSVKLYEASLHILYVAADSEVDSTVTGGWRFPQPGVAGSAVGWVWGYLDTSPRRVQTGQPLEEQASTSTYDIDEILGARVFVTGRGIGDGEATLKINGTVIGTLPAVTNASNSVRTRYLAVPESLLSALVQSGTNTLTLEGADFYVHKWGLTIDFRGDASNPSNQPVVVATSPVKGGPLVDPAANIELMFSKAMNPTTFPSNISVQGSQSGAHDVTYSYNPTNRTLTLNPVSDFAVTESVTVVANSTILSETAESLIPYTFSFNVRPASLSTVNHSTTISTNEIWTKDNVHIITSSIAVNPGIVLTIQPGTVVKFNPETYLNVNGVLLAQGTSSEPIVFTAVWDDTYGGNSGDGSTRWRSIWLNGSGSVMDYTLVRYGGRSSSSPYYDNMVRIGSGSAVRNSTLENLNGYTYYYYGAVAVGSGGELRNSVVRNNPYGVAVAGSGATLVGNTVTNNTYPVVQDPGHVVDYSNNSMSGNSYDVIAFSGTSLSGNVTWSAVPGLPYLIQNDLTISSSGTLLIEGGTIVKFTGSTSPTSTDHRNLIVDGVLLTTASVEDPVILTSFRDDDWGGDSNNDGSSNGIQGDWGGLVLKSANTLDNVLIRYGGGQRSVSGPGSIYGAVYVYSNASDIRYCTIDNSYDSAVRVSSAANPVINYCNFTSSANYGVYREGTTPVVNASNNWWGHSSGPGTVGPGSGAKVTANVDYAPWATSPISPPGSGPVITSRPNTAAQVNVNYLYDANGCAEASGIGPITWSKLRGPVDFTIDANSGCISWLPTGPGYYVITIAATDTVGTDTQTFQINVTGSGGDITPPTVTSFNWQQTGSGSGIWNALLTAVFSEPVEVSAIDVAILNSSQNVVPIDSMNYEIATHTLTITKAGLSDAETYTLILADTITDAALNPLDGDYDGHTFPSGNNVAGGDFRANFSKPLPVPADFTGDGLVNADDLAVFESCSSGPAIQHSGSETCQRADFDSDNDVDQSDFGIFQRCISGDQPADPNCAD